jgi:excisionase family DNA binding protein
VPYTTAVLDPHGELDPVLNPWLRPDDLARLGLGDRKTIYRAIHTGDIPSTKVGRKLLVPTWWVRRQLQLDDPTSEPTP